MLIRIKQTLAIYFCNLHRNTYKQCMGIMSVHFTNYKKEGNIMNERKTLGQLFVPICIETLFYMLAGMVDTLMLSSVGDQAVGAVGTANTYIGMFIIMFSVISTGMMAVMTQNIGAGKPGIAYQARQIGVTFNAVLGFAFPAYSEQPHKKFHPQFAGNGS